MYRLPSMDGVRTRLQTDAYLSAQRDSVLMPRLAGRLRTQNTVHLF